MKAKVFILALLYLCLNVGAFAQNGNNKTKICGTVRDSESGNPLEFATAVLLKGSDSTIVSSAITDENGLYAFNNIPKGDYKLRLAFMGYLDADKTININDSQKEINLESTNLQMVNNNLDAAVVTVKVPLIERKIDKLVVNVEGTTVAEGNNALDVLKKAPGVTVDQDGNIKLLGAGVLVQIDDRSTYLSATDLATLLNSMDASEITKIEIINSPSSKQDAEGSGGIINIRTRKSVISGFNGNVNAGYTFAKHNGYYGGGRLNYRNAWMGAYVSANYRSNQNYNTIEQTRNFAQTTPPSTFYSYSDSRFKWRGLNYRAGLDFYLNKTNTLGLLFTGNNGKSPYTSVSSTTNTLEGIGMDSKSDAVNEGDENNNGITLNANYRKQFAKEGQTLSADLDYAKFSTKQNGDRNNHIYDLINNRDSIWLIHTYSPRKVQVYSGKVDYVQPFWETAQLETGAKISYSSTVNELDWLNNTTGEWIYDDTRSNDFEYDERVTAAYASVGKQFGEKFSVKAGLRWENTWTKGYSPTTGETNKRNYNDFFPTVFLSYKPWKDHDFSFSFNRRIQRPSYNDLNPFKNYIDAYTYVSGNANLKPQYRNNLSLTHSFKNMLITTLMYGRQSDMIVQVPEYSNGLGESGVIQDNFGYNDVLGISISVPNLPLTKWWTASGNIWGGWNHDHSQREGVVYDNYSTVVMTNLSTTFTIAKTWRIEGNAWLSTPQSWGYFKTKAQYWMSIGIKKSFMDNKLNFTLNVNDPFKLSKNSMDVKYDKYDYHYETRWMSRRVSIGVVWRFGSTTIKPIQDRKGGNEDELSRIKTE